MSAWRHRSLWSVGTSREYGVRCAAWYAGVDLGSLDCADLAIRLIVDFAAERGLPVVLEGGGTLLDSRRFVGGTTSFLSRAQRSLSADDLRHPTNTRFVGRGAGAARPGYLLLHFTGARVTHAQVVTRVSADRRWLTIVQGNLADGFGLRTLVTGELAKRGVPPQPGVFSPGPEGFGGSYFRSGWAHPLGDLWASIAVHRWNVGGWNQE